MLRRAALICARAAGVAPLLRTELVAAAGHWVHWDAAAAVTRRLLRFSAGPDT